MWGQDPDPGGTINTPSPQELTELKDQNEQQLVLIAQLKEMLRKEQSTVSQDKVEEYVNTLNRARAKRSKQKKGESSSSTTTTTTTANIDANKKERINLLKQQLEENKARLAERGKSQKGIEEMVTQLQAQFKESQILNTSAPLNASLVETKTPDYNENTPQRELYSILLTKEKKITELLNKSQKLEGIVLDLQENVKEKDSVIDARTKAITLMTDSLSKKRKNTLDTLEETKDQMRKMQEHFVNLEAEMKARQLTLLNDLKIKNFEISELQRINGQLEDEKLELEQRLSESIPSPGTFGESSDIENVQKGMEQLQLENKTLLEKLDILEQSSDKTTIIEELQKKLEKVFKENLDNISMISQLKLQLEDGLATKFEENQRLTKESSKYQERILVLEKGLEEAILKLKDPDPSVVDALLSENKKFVQENARLTEENFEYLSKIQVLEKQLEDATTDLKLLTNTGMGGVTKSTKAENEENAKLKKQLDESNKSMIKMRAVQKGKIKELNKRLDQFRKMSDPNALIVQLQTEIIKLNEKVAELEDEKGNLQLKMVDSTTSSKEDYVEVEDEMKKLKEKLNKTELELEDKGKIIEILESEVLVLKDNLKQKSEEQIKISSQVSSEMSSICYEEQIETLETDKKKLLEQLSILNEEKENLLQELDLAKKEKQDLNAKLDSYIQENIDLIDKLEKLSAEKVSSAESIEIVEGLTQQEKLELAAYQKHLNPEESLKCPDDDHIESPAELNESVLQLSEDTAELLQKIEMFTQERKEVMQKMEALKDENNVLNLKIKEIENNRDILEETYEQLQNEKDAIINQKQELSDELDKLQKHEILKTDNDLSANVLDSELKDLQIKYEALIQENNELKRTLKDFDSLMQEKYDLESRLRELIENNTSLDTKLNSNLDEINAYQLTIEDNKTKLINSTDTINRLQSQIEERENDIQELHINITELNSVINELQANQNNFEVMESELTNLKSTLANQIGQTGDYESEIAQNSETIKKLNEELIGMNRRILELENELGLKDSETERLTKDLNNKDEIIRRLQIDINEKDKSFKVIREDIKGKYLKLQEQLENNDGSLRKEITMLSNKNQEQLEKMKKIAANLKRKTQAYQELEESYQNEKQHWETHDKENISHMAELQQKLISINQALKDSENLLRTKLEENELIQHEIKMIKEEYQNLEQNNADQQHYIQELKHKQDKLEETSLQQEMSASLHEEIDPDFSKNVPDDKIRELELLLETNESELSDYKYKISRLQETTKKLQEAKSELEIFNAELLEKLNLTSISLKEKALLEDQLELRLSEVAANDEALTMKLQESQTEHEELLKRNQEHETLIKRLKVKLKKAHDKVTELQTVQANLQDFEKVNQELRNQIVVLEDNQRQIQSENESLQRRNMSDYEKIEADYQIQLEELLKIKNDLATNNEKLLEKIKELEDREQDMLLEFDEYKTRLEQTENSHAEKIKLLQSDLEIEKSDNQKLATELTEARLRLHESTIKVEDLNRELNNFKTSVVIIDNLRQQLDALTSERDNLISSLKTSSETAEKALAECNDLKQTLQHSSEALQESSQEVNILTQETGRLKQDILALEFAKSSLEASFDSTQKLDPKEFEKPISNFEWPSEEADTSKTDVQQAEKLDLLLKDVNDKFEKSMSEKEDLKKQLSTSEGELKSAMDEANVLKSEVERLKQEIQTLQFAKWSLKESPSANSETLIQNTEGTVLEEFSHKTATPDHIQHQSAVPLFNAFVHDHEAPTTSSIFDSFHPTSNDGEDWFSQPPAQTLEVQNINPALTSNVEISAETAQPQSPPLVIEDGREALLKKIKALEFLLYNVDREKEIALDQCTEMVNELTRVIYDTHSSKNLESQVLSQADIDKLSADKTEYLPVNKNYGEQSTPVTEETIQPKKAYLCFVDDDLPKKGDKKISNLESQIMSEKDVAKASTSKKALQAIEYEKVNEGLGEQHQPVVEPLAQPKHAYLCYTKDDKPQSLEAYEENDDGWGWGPEDARLEEEHINTLENTPQVKTLLHEIQQLKENIRVLQIERENHLEEIKQLQIKSGKLIKKCKELKAKSEHATTDKKQDDGGFFDLNETIQDELKGQVDNLEKKLKEISTEYDKEKAEKANLLKRVDVLTSANERMTEMKEIQDSEIFRWQRQHQEVAEKLKEYEWGSEGFGGTQRDTTNNSESHPSVDQNSRIRELEDTIKDLSLDNEELQTLLEEERAKRLEAEKNKSIGNAGELTDIRSLSDTVHRELEVVRSRANELQAGLNNVLAEKDKLVQEKSALEDVIQGKEMLVQELQDNIETLRKTVETPSLDENQIISLNQEVSSLQKIVQEKDFIIDDLQNNLEQLATRKSELDITIAQLHNDMYMKNGEIEQLCSSLERNVTVNLETGQLKLQVESLTTTLQEKNGVIERLKAEKAFMENNQNQLNNKLQKNQEETNKLIGAKQQRDLEYETTLQDLQVKILEIQENQAIISDLQRRISEIEPIGVEKNQKDEEIQSLVKQLDEKQCLLNDLHTESNQATVKVSELNEELNRKARELEELQADKFLREAETQRLSTDIQNKDEEFQERVNALVNELNENWQIQVDQRGADVAESWKMHLEMVEKDYTSVQEKLKADALELEEKCNILVNENNELRKNVDQEIKNEVDKMSALQQQISSLQHTITSLNQVIQEKDNQIEEIQNNLSNYVSLENELQILRRENSEKENKLAGINVIIETTQKQFDEKREVVEEMVAVLEKQALFPLSYEKDDILREFQRQLGSVDEVSKLNESILELQEKLNKISGEKNREITGLNQVIEDLNKELSVIHEKESEIVRLNNELHNTQMEKEVVIQEFNLLRQEKELVQKELENVKLNHSNCFVTIENCSRQVLEYNNLKAKLEQNLDDKNKEIVDLNQQLIALQENARNDSNKEIENLTVALAKEKDEYLLLKASLSECQNLLYETTQQLAQKTQELQTINNTLVQYQQSLSYYEQENNRLKVLVDQRENEYHNSLEMLKNNQLADVQRHYDELLSNKELDLNTLRGKVQELVNANQIYGERLNEELSLKHQLEEQLREQTQLVDEDTKQLEELKLIIEDQVAKIEELKKELFDKSNQYDSLIAEVDVGRLPVTRQPLATENRTTDVHKHHLSDDDLSEPVSRAELDLALYMLHQRDVRCEELTVELTQLLEERDILQLRLSNAIREKEELRRSLAALGNNSMTLSSSSSTEVSPSQSKSSAIFLAASGTELAKDPLESEHNLATKLSELKTVGYKKDKTFVDEQEARRIQQLAIMQQHIKEASKLPPEAAAKLVDASYTLSRDVQSPPKVLLNWLWGKNPPKANDS